MVYEIDRIKAQVKNAPSGSLKSTSVTASRRTRKPIAKKGDIIRVNVKIKTVQQALQNAGYYEGNIDGKIGAQTKDAIVKFQEDNGLKSDGIIGRNTWAGLKTFLE
ncbi:MAG: peptidoglycan-binding protein [Candidatus Omnitrophica bacterium]|nr:peptidoglycan-binding protein [Candidatus Omnitrophota bacterium]